MTRKQAVKAAAKRLGITVVTKKNAGRLQRLADQLYTEESGARKYAFKVTVVNPATGRFSYVLSAADETEAQKLAEAEHKRPGVTCQVTLA